MSTSTNSPRRRWLALAVSCARFVFLAAAVRRVECIHLPRPTPSADGPDLRSRHLTGEVSMDEKQRYAAGMRVRREILGDAYVDRVVADTTDASSDFQDLITRYAWGEIWTRPGLDERTRRVLVIGTLLALKQWDQFRLHVRAALGGGRVHRGRPAGDRPPAVDLLRRPRRPHRHAHHPRAAGRAGLSVAPRVFRSGRRPGKPAPARGRPRTRHAAGVRTVSI